MKYFFMCIGLIMSCYLCVMLVMPFATVLTQKEADLHAQHIVHVFTESWNAEPQEMGKILSAKIVEVRPWMDLRSVGALVRTDMVLEHWKGFLELYISKHGDEWRIDKVVKGE